MTESRRFGLALVALSTGALAVRSLPLVLSPLPLRADGLFYASQALETVRTGAFPLERMATDDLGFTSLLASVSLVTGVDPWLVAQPTSGLIATVPVVLVVGIGRRIALVRGWNPRRAGQAGLLGGAFLAVEGLYLHRSMVTDEQTAGLVIVPLVMVASYRAVRSDRAAWWVTGIVLLALLPPLHNLEAMVVAIALTTLLLFVATRSRVDRATGKLVGVTVVFWLVFPGYHAIIERQTAAVIIQEARLTDVPGLVAAWVVGVGLLLVWLARARTRTRQVAGWAVVGTMFGLIALNATRAVFPGMPTTPPVVLAMLLPLAVPAALAAWRVPDLFRRETDGPAMLAIVVATGALIGVSLTAALTPVYLGTAYRSSLFLHLPVAIPVGLGVVAAMRFRPLEGRRSLRAGLVAVVVLCAAVSMPLSFGGLEPLNYRAVTPPGEFAAAEFAATSVEGPWATADHTRRVGAAAVPGSNGSVSPVYEWLVDGRPPPDCPVLVAQSWTTRGTQFPNTAPVELEPGEYRQWRNTSSVVYDGGGRDRFQLVVPRDGGGGCGNDPGR